jgi:hypothetical protein
LGLKNGDTLICDASDPRIATAATSAVVLQKLAKRGVELYHLDRLHAKVIRMPGHALVGSANMTVNATRLHEASVLTDDADVLRQVDEFLAETRRLKPVKIDATFLKRISAIPVVPGGGVGGPGGSFDLASPRAPVTWVARWVELSPQEHARTEATIKSMTQSDDVPTFLRWNLSHKKALAVLREDRLLLVNIESKRADRPSRISSVIETREHLIHLLDDSPDGTVSWKRLQQKLASAGAYRRDGIPSLLRLDQQTGTAVEKLYRAPRKS